MPGLRRLEPQFALDALERVGHLEELLVEVHAVPSQPEQLAPSQPEIDSEHIERMESIGLGCLQQSARLINAEATAHLVPRSLDLHQ